MLILRLFYLLGLTFSANSIRRTYYLAAVEIDWDYGNAENRELVPFRKSVFRQFSDGYYRREIPHVESLGYFGPTLIAEVGDALVVRLRNFATVSCNLQAQGVKVTSENPSYVLPHNQSTYQWEIPQESSPTYDDPPCVARLYYSSVDQIKDINSGLVGSLIICKPGWIWTVEEEPPKVLFFAISDESKSLFHHNHVVNNTHHHNEVSSLHYTINGFSFKTFPALSTCSGESTTLFLIGLSAKSTSFSITFENHVIQMRSFHVTNVVSLFTGSTEVIEITPHQDIQGRFSFYSFANEHYMNGMVANIDIYDCSFRDDHHRKKRHISRFHPKKKKSRDSDHGNQRQQDVSRDFGRRRLNYGRWSSSYDPYDQPHGMYHEDDEESHEHEHQHSHDQDSDHDAQPQVRSYFIAAEEDLWNYSPTSYDLFTGKKLKLRGEISYTYYADGRHRVGSIYMKAHYVEYTDDNFITKKPPSNPHLGALGPVIRVEIGEVLRIVFKNSASRNFNLHLDGFPFNRTNLLGVSPDGSITIYQWMITQDNIPTLDNVQCLTRMYYSNVHPIRDIATGLVGPFLICRPGSLGENGEQRNVDKEIFLHFSTINENLNWFINETISATTIGSMVKLKQSPAFYQSNLMSSVNGFGYGNLMHVNAHINDHVSLHVMCTGSEHDVHNIRIGNQTFFSEISALDSSSGHSGIGNIEIVPLNGKTVYFKPAVPGKWKISTDNLKLFGNGMSAYFKVEGNTTNTDHTSTNINDDATVRWYFIAAIEQTWEYVGSENQGGQMRGNNTVYKKVLYEEFTDATFTHRKPRVPYNGILGPVIKAEYGDIIKVVFHNQACRPYSIHPVKLMHSVEDNGDWVLEGDGIQTDFRHRDPIFVNRGSVFTGRTQTYTWKVPPVADYDSSLNPSECAVSYYYSNADATRDVHSGLVGPLLLCNQGVLRTHNIRYDIDREFYLLFKEFDENQSWYASENQHYLNQWNLNGSNIFHTINGLTHGGLVTLETEPGERIAWHVINMDSQPHSINFEGNSVLTYMNSASLLSDYLSTVSSVSVRPLLPGASTTVTMVPTNPGAWLIQDFASQSSVMGMYCIYHVRPKECRKPLGLESGLIADHQITSSSVYITKAAFGFIMGKWSARYARLNTHGHINAWMPSRSDRRPWIQVDLGSPMRITGITVQGTMDGHVRKYVTRFKILYSVNNREWAFYSRQGSNVDMEFKGNLFFNVPVTRTFSPQLLARYIRLVPIRWQNQPAVRMELLGCSIEGRCEEPQGIGSGEVPDTSITASSEYLYKRRILWEARFGRLNYRPPNSESGRLDLFTATRDHVLSAAPAWSPSRINRRQWIQVDFGRIIKVAGVITQGAKYGRWKLYVKSFALKYSSDGLRWEVYEDPVSHRAKVFRGNIDPDTAVTQTLQNPVQTRFIRIQPRSWRSRIALRFEILGCSVDAESRDLLDATPFPDNCRNSE